MFHVISFIPWQNSIQSNKGKLYLGLFSSRKVGVWQNYWSIWLLAPELGRSDPDKNVCCHLWARQRRDKCGVPPLATCGNRLP